MDLPRLVPPDWLRRHRDRVQVVDCRFELGDRHAGRRAYLAGHVPGAAFLDVDRDLSSADGPGRHPLPDAACFTAAARRAGIRDDVPVIAYDQRMAGGAARLWWLLRHHGRTTWPCSTAGWPPGTARCAAGPPGTSPER